MVSEDQLFEKRNQEFISKQGQDPSVIETTQKWLNKTFEYEYSYHFRWMGIPIIQYPQDIIAMQEIIWRVKPDLIIETGIARGGSLIFYASMLKMMNISGEVVGIDIDIRPHNRELIENHPMFEYITMLEGSSTDEDIVNQAKEMARNKKRVMVLLDSLHTHQHVLQELELYSPLVTPGSYLVVFDTLVEDLESVHSENRPWSKGDNPKTAVREFLSKTDRFSIDTQIEQKLLITVAPGGYLYCKE